MNRKLLIENLNYFIECNFNYRYKVLAELEKQVMRDHTPDLIYSIDIEESNTSWQFELISASMIDKDIWFIYNFIGTSS